MTLVVADSGPLIVFGRSAQLDLIRQVAGTIVISQTVFRECTKEAHKPGAIALSQAADQGILTVHDDVNDQALLKSAAFLDDGERSALALALHLRCPVLMDERIGRKVAQQQQIALIGSAGILILAKQRGLIDTLLPTLDAWQTMGYFISPPLKARILELAGEL